MAIQKWEYAELTWATGDNPVDVIFPGQPVQQFQESIAVVANRLGMEGWELVGTFAWQPDYTQEATLYFKRPKA